MDFQILKWLDEYGTLTSSMFLRLLMTPDDYADTGKRKTTYWTLCGRLKRLWHHGEIQRLRGMQEIVYSLQKVKQLPHRLARASLHLCVELFCRRHPAYEYDWVNESGRRQELAVADAVLQVACDGRARRFQIEIDQSTENVVQVIQKMQAHLTQREELRTRDLHAFHPYTILFVTNNIDNRLNRVLRRMATVEASQKHPRVILYTAQDRYAFDHPDAVFFDPIWQTAHDDTRMALTG